MLLWTICNTPVSKVRLGHAKMSRACVDWVICIRYLHPWVTLPPIYSLRMVHSQRYIVKLVVHFGASKNTQIP